MKDVLLILLAVLLVLGGTCLIAFPFTFDYGEIFDKVEDKKDPPKTDDTDDSNTDDLDPPGDGGSDNTETPPAGEGEGENTDTPSEVDTVNLWIGAETTVSDSDGNSSTYSYENVKLELNKAYTFIPKEQGTYYFDKNYVSQEAQRSDNNDIHSGYEAEGVNVDTFEDTYTITFTEKTSYFLYEYTDLITVGFSGSAAGDLWNLSCASGSVGPEVCYGVTTSLKNYPVEICYVGDSTIYRIIDICYYCSNLTGIGDLSYTSTGNGIVIWEEGASTVIIPTDHMRIYYKDDAMASFERPCTFSVVNQTSIDVIFADRCVPPGSTVSSDDTLSSGATKTYSFIPSDFGNTFYLCFFTYDVKGFSVGIRTDPDDSQTQIKIAVDGLDDTPSFEPVDGMTYYIVEVPY